MPGEFEIAALVAKKLFEMIGGKASAKIMAELFPDSPPSWLPEIYSNVEKIVKRNLVANDISNLTGSFWGLQAQIKSLASQNLPPDKYKSALNKSVQVPLLEDIGKLMQADKAEVGLPLFLLAASQSLGILTDLKVSASFYEDTAKKYIKHAMGTYWYIQLGRDNAVEVGRGDKRIKDLGHDVPGAFYEWHDTITDRFSEQRYYFGPLQGEWAKYMYLRDEDHAKVAIELDRTFYLNGSGMMIWTQPTFNWPVGYRQSDALFNFPTFVGGLIGELTEKLGDPPTVCNVWEYSYLNYPNPKGSNFNEQYAEREDIKKSIPKNDEKRPISKSCYYTFRKAVPSWKGKTSLFDKEPDPLPPPPIITLPPWRAEGRNPR